MTKADNAWVIADTHFGHKNIIDYADRPFKDVQEMNDEMIYRWNKTVLPGDQIYILGDFALTDKATLENILGVLNGRKFLIVGNHDKGIHQKLWFSMGIELISPFPIIIDQFFILSHEPMYINNHMPYANIYGHVHSDATYKDVTKQSFCACVERINYTPICLGEIKRRMEKADESN